jgi:hypothetical protein
VRFYDLFGMPSLGECARELVWQILVKLCGEARPLTGPRPRSGGGCPAPASAPVPR